MLFIQKVFSKTSFTMDSLNVGISLEDHKIMSYPFTYYIQGNLLLNLLILIAIPNGYFSLFSPLLTCYFAWPEFHSPSLDTYSNFPWGWGSRKLSPSLLLAQVCSDEFDVTCISKEANSRPCTLPMVTGSGKSRYPHSE